MMPGAMWGMADMERRLANLIRPGTVSALDAAAARVRVKAGDLETAWLPWLTHRAGPDRTYWAPEVGEQVLVLSPSGEMAQGFVLPAVFRSAHPAPASSADTHRQEYKNGTVVEHDRAAQHYQVSVPSGGKITLQVGQTSLVLEDGQTKLTTPQLTVDSPDSLFTGDVTAEGLLMYLAGMVGQGGTGATASITGDINVSGGDVAADGVSLKTHTHPENDGGNTGAPN